MAYKTTRHTEQSLQKLLYEWKKIKGLPKASNVYFYGGKKKRWESDFAYISKIGELFCLDCKVDTQDCYREFERKAEKHELLKEAFDTNNSQGFFLPNYFYLVVPEELLPFSFDIPEYVGILAVNDKDQIYYYSDVVQVHDQVDRGLNYEMFTTKVVDQRIKDELKLIDFMTRADACQDPECYQKEFERFKKAKRV